MLGISYEVKTSVKLARALDDFLALFNRRLPDVHLSPKHSIERGVDFLPLGSIFAPHGVNGLVSLLPPLAKFLVSHDAQGTPGVVVTPDIGIAWLAEIHHPRVTIVLAVDDFVFAS